VLFVVVQWARELILGRRGPLEDIWHLSDWLLPLAFLRRPFARPANQLRTYLLRIVTVTGPLPPQQARVILPHEHVILDLRGAERHPSHGQEDAEHLLRQIHDYVGYLPLYGAQTLFDGATQQQGRNPTLLHRLSVSTGVQIVTNTGYTAVQGGRFLPPHSLEESADQIAERWLAELRDGIEGTNVRPGFIKIGLDPGSLQEVDRKLVIAAARTHLQTGLTIASDTAHYESAAAQLALLEAEGVAPEAWVWLHAQRETRTDGILEAAHRGAWVLVDDLAEESVSRRVLLLRYLKDRGLLGRTLISQNAPGYQPGYARPLRVQRYDRVFKLLIPSLMRADFTPEDISRLTVVNPRSAYTTRIRPAPETTDPEHAPRKLERGE
jgi:phosphotriesterase-related protein